MKSMPIATSATFATLIAGAVMVPQAVLATSAPLPIQATVVCNSVDAAASYRHLELSADQTEIVLTQSPMPGAPVFKIEHAQYSPKSTMISQISGSIFQAFSCPGSCGTTKFTLSSTSARIYPNAHLVIESTRFNENSSQNEKSVVTSNYSCAVTGIESLPAFGK